MDKRIHSILDYIDGNMEASERAAFAKELNDDPSLHRQYLYHININNNLAKLPLVQAPISMMDNIMVSISDKSFSAAKYSSFSGIKFIIAMAIAFIASLLLVGLLFSADITVTHSTYGFAEYIDKIMPAWEMPSSWITIAPYVCFTLAIPLFAILDNYIGRVSYSNL